jgi:imidazolonepropionase-like amidohydrolase
VTAPGQVIPKGTIVIRNGLITAVSPTAVVPGDARTVDANGLTVYPGFIDAYSNLGYEGPTIAQAGNAGRGGANAAAAARAADPAPNSLNRPGLQPEVTALALLVDNADYASPQAAGFTAALTAPSTGIFVGQSAVISLRNGDVQSILVKSPIGMHIGFGGIGRGGYPGSLLGVFAALRQELLDAQRYGKIMDMYTANPRGMARPENDPSSAALQPALKGQMPVYFSVTSEREIERALDLAKEFGLKPVIVGGAEADQIIDRLKAENVPVLYSLAFTEPGQGGAGGRGGRGGGGDGPEPIRMLRQRVQEPKTPAELQKAGVTFALQQGGNGFGQFITHLQRVVASGLSKDDALRAITVTPATILGISDRLGTIEVGKIANLTLTHGDLFDQGVRVAQVFVDGQQFEIAPGAARGSGAPMLAADGTWKLTISITGTDYPVTLSLTQEGSNVRGTLQGSLGSTQISAGTIDQAGNIRFTSPITAQTTEEATFTGTVNGNQMSGTMTIIGEPSGGRFAGTRGTASRPPLGQE